MSQLFDGDPKTAKGAIGWVVLAAVAAMVALLASQLVPGIIPVRAAQSNL